MKFSLGRCIQVLNLIKCLSALGRNIYTSSSSGICQGTRVGTRYSNILQQEGTGLTYPAVQCVPQFIFGPTLRIRSKLLYIARTKCHVHNNNNKGSISVISGCSNVKIYSPNSLCQMVLKMVTLVAKPIVWLWQLARHIFY